MPRYWFELKGDSRGTEVDLPDDQAAWAQLLQWGSEILRELDHGMAAETAAEFSVSEGTRHIATVRFIATRKTQ
jgi:hypothetical protein